MATLNDRWNNAPHSAGSVTTGRGHYELRTSEETSVPPDRQSCVDVNRLEPLIERARESLDAAIESVNGHCTDAALDDLLAARLLLSTAALVMAPR